MANQRQLALGAFLVIVLTLLGVYTLFLTDFSLFQQRHDLVVEFTQANGLRKGDSVLVAGIREGKVNTLAYDPSAPLERRITATLTLDHAVALREGFEIAIEDATVLGGKQVTIDPGPPEGAPVVATAALQGRVKGGALDGLGQLVDRNGAKLERILDDVQTMVSDVKEGKGTVGRLMRDEALAQAIADGATSVKDSFDNIKAVSDEVRAGKGLLGRLATDEDLANKFEEVATNLQQITEDFKAVSADMQAGKGVLGRLAKDEQLGDDIAQAVATIKDITSRINAAEGSLWKFIEDPTIADNVERFTSKLEGGTIGKLFSNEELFSKIDRIADDLVVATNALRNGEGTLGRLVMDRELYEQVQRALGILTGTLEEYREAAPITTFSSILFSGF